MTDGRMPGGHTHLEEISTRWSTLSDPLLFVMRYAPAIRRYLIRILESSDAADEVCQDFLVRYLAQGFAHASPHRGRFRRYLKAAVRNAARMHLRHMRTASRHLTQPPARWELDQEAAPDTDTFEDSWRSCVLERTWNALYQLEQSGGQVPYHTVLRLAVDHPEEDSSQLASRVSEHLGRPIRADAVRQQHRRGRRLFAELLVREVAQTLEVRTPEALAEELEECGLMAYVRDHLPEDWTGLLTPERRAGS